MDDHLDDDLEAYIQGLKSSIEDDEVGAVRPGAKLTVQGRLGDTPITTTGLVKLSLARTIHGKPVAEDHPELRKGCSLAREVNQFWVPLRAELARRETLGHAQPTGYSVMTAVDTIDLIEGALAEGEHRPMRINTRAASRAYRLVQRAMRDRTIHLADPVTDIPSTVGATWAAWTALQRPFDRMRRNVSELGAAHALVCTQLGRLTVFITPNGVATLRGSSLRFGTFPILLAALEALENMAKGSLSMTILRSTEIESAVNPQLLLDIAKWQRDTVRTYGSAGHAIAKGVEALAKAQANLRGRADPPDRLSGHARMLRKIQDKEVPLNADTPMALRLAEILDRLETPEGCCEASGLLRFCGYPVCDPAESADSSRRQGGAPSVAQGTAVLDCVRILKHLVAKNYIEKHGSWPRIEWNDLSRGTALRRLHDHGSLNLADRSYPLSDWDGSSIVGIAEFMYHEDYLDLIADKASNEGVALKGEAYRGRLSQTTTRRLISRILESESIVTKDEVDAFAADEMDPDVFAAGLAPKGGEFKAEARAYTIIHFKVRLVLSIIQENVKECLFPYLPYTSMAMGAAELSRTLHTMTSSSSGVLWLLETDMSRWNLQFRRFWSELAGREMDKMCGVVGLFGQSHRFFQRSEFSITTHDARIPHLEDTTLRENKVSGPQMFWGDEAGKEGIEQRFWTVLTICMFYYALWDEPYAFKMMGQGDNLTLAIQLGDMDRVNVGPTTERLSRLIEAKCLELNHIAKPDEFLDAVTGIPLDDGSTSKGILTYSKVFFQNGRQLPMESKFGMKVGATEDEFLPSLEESIGSIFSAGVAVARNARRPLDCWYLACVCAENYLAEAAQGNSAFDQHTEVAATSIMASPDQTLLALMVPSQIGGFPVVPWVAFLYSGDPDPLSQAISMVRAHSRTEAIFRGVERYLAADSSYVARPNPARLLEDPFAIPLRQAQSPASVVKDAARHVLTAARNREISELARATNSSSNGLIQSLLSIRPFHPHLLKDMLDISVIGRCERILGKFQASSTLGRVIRDMGQAHMLPELAIRRIGTLAARFSAIEGLAGGAGRLLPSGLSHVVADSIRCRWGLGAGVIQGVSTVQPLDWAVDETAGPGVVLTVDSNWDEKEAGPRLPYFSTRTKERRAEKEYEVSRAPGTADLGKLVLSATAGAVGPVARALYESIARSRTDMSLDELTTVFPTTVGGTPAHRYDSLQSGGRIGPIGNPAYRAWMEVSTDNIPGLSASDVDWPIPVQAFLSYTMALASADMRGPATRGRRLYRVRLSTEPLARLEDIPREALVPPPYLAPMRHNSLAFVPAVGAISVARRLGGSREELGSGLADKVLGLTSVLLWSLIASGGGRLAADISPDSGTLAGIDQAVISVCGGYATYQAVVRAVATAATWFMVWYRGAEQDRHVLGLLVDNLSSSAANSILPLLRHRSVDRTHLEDIGVWVPAHGTAGRRAEDDCFRRAVRGAAILRLRGVEDVTDLLDGLRLPEVVQRPPPLVEIRLRLSLVVWGCARATGGAALGPLKNAVAGLRASLMAEGNAIALDSNTGVAAGLAAIRGAIEQMQIELPAEFLGLAIGAAGRLRTFAGDTTTILRRLRIPRRDAPIRVPRPAATLGPGGGEVAAVRIQQFDDTQFARMEGPLPAAEGRDEAEAMAERALRTHGTRSTVGQVWFDVFRPSDTNVLVVGTGAGGIQAVLSGRGARSEGLDLAATLPVGARAELPLPASVASDDRLATLSPLMLSTTGDWFDSDVSRAAMARQAWSTVVVDIEQGATRVGLAILDPILEARFSGGVIARLILTRSECESVAAILAKTFGRRHLSIYAGGRRPPTAIARPVIFRFRASGQGALATHGPRAAITSWPERILATDLSPPAERFARASLILTGGLVQARNLPELIRAVEEEIDAATRSRAATHRGTLLSHMKILASLVPLGRLVEEWADGLARGVIPESNYDEAFRLGQLSQGIGFPGWTTRNVTLRSNDPAVLYNATKVVPRLCAATLDMMRPA